MNFLNIIKNNMYQAMKENDKKKVLVLRSLLSKLKDKQIDNGKSLNKEESLNIVKKYVKQIKESIIAYKKANRFDLVEKEHYELSILESYLPKMMSNEEIRNIVILAIKETGVKNINEIGKVMPVIMKLGGAIIDGKKANIILRELLS